MDWTDVVPATDGLARGRPVHRYSRLAPPELRALLRGLLEAQRDAQAAAASDSPNHSPARARVVTNILAERIGACRLLLTIHDDLDGANFEAWGKESVQRYARMARRISRELEPGQRSIDSVVGDKGEPGTVAGTHDVTRQAVMHRFREAGYSGKRAEGPEERWKRLDALLELMVAYPTE